MRVFYTPQFEKTFRQAPPTIQKLLRKQLHHLLQNIQYPSLRAKKYDEAKGIWQARVDRNWRFYFSIEGDAVVLHTIRPHPK